MNLILSEPSIAGVLLLFCASSWTLLFPRTAVDAFSAHHLQQKYKSVLLHVPYSSTRRYSTTDDTETIRAVPTPRPLSSTPQERALKAKQIWSTIALQPTSNTCENIKLDSETTTIYNQNLFDQFLAVKGTYFVNGLSTCQIGDRLIHPFEAHGYCKSIVFDGQGSMEYTSRIVETPLNKLERSQNKIINRGVMSTVADMDSLWGNLKNALSSRERDTANLTANLWPPPGTNNKDNIDPLLIVCTDNGEPYALDPKTLKTKGALSKVLPKLASIFPPGTKCLAHTRYDALNNRFIMCKNTMLVPGEDNNMEGNTLMEFIEFDNNFDAISQREFTTRFMVFHDWVVTQNYYVVPKNPAYLKWLDIAKFSFGMSLGTDVFAMEEETNGEFILIPRHDKGADVREVEGDAFFTCFHFGPAFEQKNDKGENELVINACVFDQYTFGGEMGFDGISQEFDPIGWGSSGMAPPPRLDQYVIDADSFQVKRKERVPVIPVDMPNFDGDARYCQYSYFLGASRPEGWFPFQQIVKLDLETFESVVYDAGDGQVVSEPMFIPRDEAVCEDDGFVISIVHNVDDKDAKLMIWDSPTFADGPIAECSLGVLIPWCVHGSFYPSYNP